MQDYSKYDCLYCRLSKNQVSWQSYQRRPEYHYNLHVKCDHFSNPVQNFHCKTKPQRSTSPRQYDLKNVLSPDLKSEFANKMPFFFGDSFRDDEVYLNPEELNREPKEKVDAHTKNSKSGWVRDNTEGGAQDDRGHRAKNNTIPSTPSLKSSSSKNKETPSEMQRGLATDSLYAQHLFRVNNFLNFMNNSVGNVQKIDQSELERQTHNINFLNTIIEQNEDLMASIFEKYQSAPPQSLTNPLEKSDENEKNVITRNFQTFADSLYKRLESHRTNLKESQVKDDKQNFSFSIDKQPREGDHMESGNQPGLIRDSKFLAPMTESSYIPDQGIKGSRTGDNMRGSSDLLQSKQSLTINDHLKSELLRILESDLQDLRTLKQKFFEVLLSIDEGIGEGAEDREIDKVLSLKDELRKLESENADLRHCLNEYIVDMQNKNIQLDSAIQSGNILVENKHMAEQISAMQMHINELEALLSGNKSADNENLKKVIENLSLIIISKAN